MKKILAAVLCVALCITCLAACGSKSTSTESKTTATSAGESTGLANPMTEVASLDELNSQLGAQFVRPDESVTDESFYVISADGTAPVGQYQFTLNGLQYCVRFCSDFEAAISGVYVNGAELYSDANAADYHDFSVSQTDDGFCAHWMNVGGQYTMLVSNAGDMDQSAFEEIASAYSESTIPDQNG